MHKNQPLSGNMLIAQSGGPTAVINQTLVGAVHEARNHTAIKHIYGAAHGIQGLLEESFIDLRAPSTETLEAIAQTPGAALGSVRKKPTDEDCHALFRILTKHNIRFFFYIGGNDSAETAHIINQAAHTENYELRCFHLCKTIDNDLLQNDHTPGYGSAAKFVAQAFMGDDLDNRALCGVKINIVMGRHAGFLTAASALGRQRPDDGPHLIYLPERPFSLDQFVQDVEAVYARLGRCVISASEGLATADGTPLLASAEKDAHGNVQLSGTGALGDLLAQTIKSRTSIARVRADTFGYLQRSFVGCFSETDAREAFQVGKCAVQEAIKGNHDGSIAIKRNPGADYAVHYECVPLKHVAKETRCMPEAFIHPNGHDITEAFLAYARPLAGPLPSTTLLSV